MIDEIDYFPRRDKFKGKADPAEEWNRLKKKRTAQGSKKPRQSPPESGSGDPDTEKKSE